MATPLVKEKSTLTFPYTSDLVSEAQKSCQRNVDLSLHIIGPENSNVALTLPSEPMWRKRIDAEIKPLLQTVKQAVHWATPNKVTDGVCERDCPIKSCPHIVSEGNVGDGGRRQFR